MRIVFRTPLAFLILMRSGVSRVSKMAALRWFEIGANVRLPHHEGSKAPCPGSMIPNG